MFPTTVSLLFMWFWGLCYGFVLISSAAAGSGGVPEEQQIFKEGGAWTYQYHTTILLNEKGSNDKSVGFFIAAQVVVESVWSSSSYGRLLKVTVKSPKLFIRSRNAPEPDGFTAHTSKLESLTNAPYYILWNRGKVEKVLLRKGEPSSLANLKKGLASLFQFQLLDLEVNETDSSGHCTATYTSLSPNKFRKSKHSCASPDFSVTENPELLLSTTITSSRKAKYELDDDLKYLTSVEGEETHEMYTEAKEEIGNKVEAHQILKFVETGTSNVITAATFEEVLGKISDEEGVYTQESLTSEKELIKSDDAKSLVGAVNDYRDSLKSKHLGSLGSAKSFISLVAIGRKSNRQDVVKVLGAKKNQKILHQLMDVLGYVQSLDAHEAVMKKIRFDDENQIDLSERYLWALSISSQPNPDIISDLLNRYQKSVAIPEKVKETLLLTIASMTNRLSKSSQQNGKHKVIKTVVQALLNGLGAAKSDERLVYLRALRNLRLPQLIPNLLSTATNFQNLRESVLAWKALRAIDKSDWNKDVLDAALRTFYELDRKQDSSSRTLSADIILQFDPTDLTLKHLLYYLLSEDKAFEVKQYVLQQIRMISGEDDHFRKRIANLLREDRKINNYAVLGQKGLSTALSRKFLQGTSSNGSLLTIQEMYGGIVKRGTVNVMMDKNGVSQEIFSLGVFSGGLGAFLSSDSEGDSEETATAGMELSVLGTQIRPFTFFQGQGELMGHVWSGTASEKTTAFQALTMLQDHSEFIRLGSGFIAEFDLKGATSFDLSGKIEFSLWNRNAVSLVEKSAGIVLIGSTKVDASFVKSQVEFNVSLEPKLNLQTDINFYSGVNLCMRLSQPDTLFRHSIFKIERIPGSKHRLRKVKYKKYTVPGKTYALNNKNNEMCNIIFN